jgi:hypothetical protein
LEAGIAVHTNLTTVQSGDYISEDIALTAYNSYECVDEWTPTGLENVCGSTYEYVVEAQSRNTGASEVGYFYNVSSTGPDAPPNGGLYPWAFPAVYESYGDVDCENEVEFEFITLQANNTGCCTLTPYVGTSGPSGGGLSSCVNGADSFGSYPPGGTTYVY